MEGVKRKHHPRLDQIMNKCDAKADEVNTLLTFDLETIKDCAPNLKQYISQLKKVSLEFGTLAHVTVCALFKVGSIEDGNKLRESKTEKRQEAKELIACALSYLETLGIEDEISNLHSGTSSVYTTRSRRLSCDDILEPSPFINTPVSDTKTQPEPFLNLISVSNALLQSTSQNVIGQSTSTSQQVITTDHLVTNQSSPIVGSLLQNTSSSLTSNNLNLNAVSQSIDNLGLSLIHI